MAFDATFIILTNLVEIYRRMPPGTATTHVGRGYYSAHTPIAWQGNKSPHLPCGGLCVLAKSRTRRGGEKMIEHWDGHGKEHVAGHPLRGD